MKCARWRTARRRRRATVARSLSRQWRDVAKGVELVAQAHAAFGEVSATIAGGTQLVSQIATSSDEQARGIANIGQAITRIESLTQRNVTNAQQTADGASAMTSQVENTRRYLDELVAVVGLRSA